MSAHEQKTRTEHDSLGEVQVPADALWGAQTQRAVENFPVSGQRLEPAHLHALALVKWAAAETNAELGVLDADRAEAVAAAAEEVVAGAARRPVPGGRVPDRQRHQQQHEHERGAGPAGHRSGWAATVHPNDHVNASQSSNDVFPTSIHLAATRALVEQLLPALDHLAISLERKAAEHVETVKSGRTHLMDATPVTLGQELGGYAAAVRYGVERVEGCLPRVGELPLGGHRGGHRHQHPGRVRRGASSHGWWSAPGCR